ncbi:MAG: cytidine deaminase [Porphyromonas sp.]|nr:cytidine deaminase [Porphyromonas sp.]
MKRKEIVIPLEVAPTSELVREDQELISEALKIAKEAYAPYSKFHVGAAARLASGHIVSGSNQENAAYPSGLCAERTALFYAGAHHPNDPVEALAVVAVKGGEGTQVRLAAPCGACRQVFLETADRHKHPFRVLLAGPEETTIVKDCRDMLPINFDASSL